MVDLEGHFIIIKNVPCHKCSQCGEVSYNGEIVAKIEAIINRLKKELAEVAIVDFAAAMLHLIIVILVVEQTEMESIRERIAHLPIV